MRYFSSTTTALRRAIVLLSALCCSGAFASSEPELVKNGDFSSSTLTNWTFSRKDSTNITGQITSGAYVITRAAVAAAGDTNTWNVQFSHKGISLQKGKSYIVSFKAKSDSSFKMEVNVGMNKDPWSSYSNYLPFTLKNTWDSLSFEFTMAEATDDAARLVFDMGLMSKIGKIYLDNISVRAVASSASGELVRNGDFSSTAVTAWTINAQKGAAATRSVVDGKLVVNITKFAAPDSTPERYFIQLQQTGISLQKGLEYEIKFHAKSDSIYQIMGYIGQNKDPWANYSGWNFSPMLGPDWDTTYSTTFLMDSLDDAGARLVFDIGDAAGVGARKVYFDNISVKAIGGTAVNENRFVHGAAPVGCNALFHKGNLLISNISAPVSAELFDVTGKQIAKFGTASPQNGTASFALNHEISKAMYLLRVKETTGPNSIRTRTALIINR